MKNLVAVILVALTFGACTSTSAPVVQPTPQIVYVTPAPAITAAPAITLAPVAIVQPTPTPTIKPTPTPEPTPAFNVEDRLNYLAYLEWWLAWGEEQVEYLSGLADALAVYDDVNGYVYASLLLDSNKEAQKWLKANKPAACWAKHYSLTSKAVAHMVKGGTAGKKWLFEYPYGSDKSFNTYIQETNRADADLDAASSLFDKGLCNDLINAV